MPAGVMRDAAERLDPTLQSAFATAIARRRLVSEAERGAAATEVQVAPGASVRQRMVPVGRVGLYVPGGLARWPPA